MELADFFQAGGRRSARFGRPEKRGFDFFIQMVEGFGLRPVGGENRPGRGKKRKNSLDPGRPAAQEFIDRLPGGPFFSFGDRVGRRAYAPDRPVLVLLKSPFDRRPAKRQGSDFSRNVGPAGTEGKRFLDSGQDGLQGNSGLFPGRDQADVGRRKGKRRSAQRDETIGDRPVVPCVFHRSEARSFCRS